MSSKTNLLVILGLVIVIGVFISGYSWVQYLHKAHSSFNNYYAFRGCIQLMKRTNTYGICRTDSGQIIKIVKYNNKWYLDGDLPVCWNGICF